MILDCCRKACLPLLCGSFSCKPPKKDYNESTKRTNLHTTITLSLLLGISLLSLTGCQNTHNSAEPETNAQSPAEESPVEPTLLTTPEISGDGLEAVLALAEDRLNSPHPA